MADVPPVDATMSNSESQPPQVKTAETLDLNMSTNDTLPADVLGNLTADTVNPTTISADNPPVPSIPAEHTLRPDLAQSQPPSETLPPPPPEPQFPGHAEPAPTPALTNGTHSTTTTTATSPPTTALPPTTVLKPSHSPAPTRGSTPAPSNPLHPTAPSQIIPPTNGSAAGSPTRAYMNIKVTPALLEGMKWVARNEPEKPLKWLGEFLLAKSREVEGV